MINKNYLQEQSNFKLILNACRSRFTNAPPICIEENSKGHLLFLNEISDFMFDIFFLANWEGYSAIRCEHINGSLRDGWNHSNFRSSIRWFMVGSIWKETYYTDCVYRQVIRKKPFRNQFLNKSFCCICGSNQVFITNSGHSSLHILCAILAFASTLYSINPWYYIAMMVPKAILSAECSLKSGALAFITDVTESSNRMLR